MSELTSSNWSETAASNAAAPPDGAPEGWNPSDANNVVREGMSALKKFFNRISGAYTAGGGTTAYTLSPTVALAAYADEIWSWIMPSTNAVDATMNVSGLGARNVQKLTTAGYVNVIAGDMPSGAMIQARYSSSTSKFYILSATSGADLTQAVLLASLKSFSPPGHRLSLTTAVPVTVSDVTAAGTVYWTPDETNITPVYNGTAWVLSAIAETSVPLDSNAGHTGYHQSGKNFDVFLDYNAGTPRVVTGPAWSSDTGRASAISRDATYGWYVNTSSMTAKFDTSVSTVTIAAGAGLYLGMFRTTADAQTEDSAAKRFLWNTYNRVARPVRNATETADSWTYTTATIRQANANAANQLDFVRGLDEDAVSCLALARWANDTVSANGVTLIGLDSTTTAATGCLMTGMNEPVTNIICVSQATWNGLPGLGRHFLAWLERASGGGTQSWTGDAGAPTLVQSGISGEVFA